MGIGDIAKILSLRKLEKLDYVVVVFGVEKRKREE
jgi:hypothetical protein